METLVSHMEAERIAYCQAHGKEYALFANKEATIFCELQGDDWVVLNNELISGVKSITVYKGDLVVLGDRIVTFNGSEWALLGCGVCGKVYDMIVYNGDLIVCGDFFFVKTKSGIARANHIAKWDGNDWGTLKGGMVGGDFWPRVNVLAVYGGCLIAGGRFVLAGGVSANHIAKWNGSKWGSLGNGINHEVTAVSIYNEELIAGGCFSKAGDVSVNSIARWNGTYWDDIAGGFNRSVQCLAVYNKELIVGGDFTKAGGAGGAGWIAAHHVAKLHGDEWIPMGAGMDHEVHTFAVFDGKIFAYSHEDEESGSDNGISILDGENWFKMIE